MTREVYKWKARLNLDGSKMLPGKHYDLTHTPVASWESIRLVLALTLKNRWKTRCLDYVLAYPQAPVERECYMKIPRGITIDSDEEYLLKVKQNIYGQKQAGRVWNQYLLKKLKEAGFVKSHHDDCILFYKSAVYVLYTADSILAGPDDKVLDEAVQVIKDIGLDVTEEEGGLEDFLGVNIKRVGETRYHLSQPHLIEQILKDTRMDGDYVSTKATPALSSTIITAHPDSPDFVKAFDYRSVIGKLNYLKMCTRPDVAYAVHQCARHAANPKAEHGNSVRRIT